MIPEDEVGCKICEKSIYRIFYEHVQAHIDNKEHLDPQTTKKNWNLKKATKYSLTFSDMDKLKTLIVHDINDLTRLDHDNVMQVIKGRFGE